MSFIGNAMLFIMVLSLFSLNYQYVFSIEQKIIYPFKVLSIVYSPKIQNISIGNSSMNNTTATTKSLSYGNSTASLSANEFKSMLPNIN